MPFLRSILVLFIFTTLSWSCAVCKVQVPDVNVSITQSHSDEAITLDILWDFKSYFSAETRLTYDENRNEVLDPEEIATIHSNFIEYLDEENYVTQVKYIKEAKSYEEAKHVTFDVLNSKTEFTHDRLSFKYTLQLHTKPRKDETLYVSLYDGQGYFRFHISEILPQDTKLKETVFISDFSALFIPFGNVAGPSNDHKANIESLTYHISEEEAVDEPEGFVGLLSVAMNGLKERVLDLVEDIVMNESIISYIWLLFFSFIYGIIHALGPGHGKSLVAAYFLGNNRSTFKAFSIASLIGVVHTFSAFILTFTLYYLLNAYLSEYFNDLEYVTIKISAVIIILIALYLLYKKLPRKKKKIPLWSLDDPNAHQASCGCGACRNTSGDLGIILSAGIVPCPGTITIFVFALSFGAYMVGFLSAVFMSIGMSIVIFAAALLSLKVRKNTARESKMRTILDYGSLLFIFSLGLILLLI